MTILGDPEESSRHQNYSAFDTNGTPDAIQALASSSKTELKGREEFEKLLFIYDNKLRSGPFLQNGISKNFNRLFVQRLQIQFFVWGVREV